MDSDPVVIIEKQHPHKKEKYNNRMQPVLHQESFRFSYEFLSPLIHLVTIVVAKLIQSKKLRQKGWYKMLYLACFIFFVY
jgi:hypothetical protein